jgi:hypothetical protein
MILSVFSFIYFFHDNLYIFFWFYSFYPKRSYLMLKSDINDDLIIDWNRLFVTCSILDSINQRLETFLLLDFCSLKHLFWPFNDPFLDFFSHLILPSISCLLLSFHSLSCIPDLFDFSIWMSSFGLFKFFCLSKSIWFSRLKSRYWFWV